MKYCVIFDADGTLFDTGEGICDCAVYALEKVGAPPIDSGKLVSFIGPSLFYSFTETVGLDEQTALKAIEHYRERYQKVGIDTSRPYDGVGEMLKRLHGAGFVLAVASNKPKKMVEYLLDKYGFSRYFEKVCAPDFAVRSSDKSRLIEEAKSGDENIMVGDTKFDIEGAHNAGIKAIAAAYGYGERGTLSGADFIVEAPTDVCAVAERERTSLK